MNMNTTAVFGSYDHFSKSNDVKLGNPHYYPSDNKELDGKTKGTILSTKYMEPPQRYEKTAYTIMGGEAGDVKNEVLPDSVNSLLSIDSSGSSKYNESWLGTEHSFSNLSDVTAVNIVKPDMKEHSVEEYLEKHKDGQHTRGTLSKFVQRFREQPPLPRTQRFSKDGNGQPDFWWLSSPTQIMSSTPKSSDLPNLSPESNSILTHSSSNQSSSLFTVSRVSEKTAPSITFEDESDSGIARMQLRTDKLLSLSESEIMGKVTSANSSATQRFSPANHNKPIAPGNVENHIARPIREGFKQPSTSENVSVHLSKFPKPLKPEDDILYRWRLSRKMNLASQNISASKSAFLINHNKSSSDNNKYDVPGKKEEESKEVKKTIARYRNEGQSSVDIKKVNVSEPDECDENISCSMNKSVVQCMDECMNCKQTQQEPTVRNCCAHICCTNKSCVCNNGVEYKETCRCSNVNTHIPPHTHDICDILPCTYNSGHSDALALPQVRKGHTKLHTTSKRSQKSDERVGDTGPHKCSDQKAVDSYNSTPGKDHVTSDKFSVILQEPERSNSTKTEKVENIDSKENNVTPVIKQVISNHLFQNESGIMCSPDESSVVDGEHHHGDSENNILQHMSSLSDDEFLDDDILIELRCRRRKIENELNIVCEQLKKKEEKLVGKNDDDVTTRRMVK